MIEPGNLQDLYPLSPLQEGMLFHSILDPGSAAYLEQMSFKCSGPIRLECFQAALDALVLRHPVLRTAVIHEKTKRPLQAVLKRRPIAIRFEDLRSLDEQLQCDKISSLQQVDAATPFDLGRDPLLRLAICRTAECEHWIIWTHHHILMDGWCVGILQSEFLRLYEGLVAGKPVSLPPVRPYSLYLQWLEKRDAASSLFYWQQLLDGCSTPSTLPGRKGCERLASERLNVQWDDSLSGQLAEFARNAGVTPNVVLLALWAVLLSRYNDSLDAVFGTVVSGRPPDLEGAEEIVGLFINTLPVRIQVRRGESVLSLCRRVMELQVQAGPHHHSSLGEIQSRTPLKQRLIDHLFVFENYPEAVLGGVTQSGLQIELAGRREQTNYDFVLVIQPGREYQLEFQFNPGAYPGRQVQSIASHYRAVVAAAVSDPAAEALSLLTVSAAEQNSLLGEFSGCNSSYPRDATIGSIFDDQVSRNPQATALSFEGSSWSYAALDGLASACSARFAAAGVRSGGIIAFHCRRSPFLVAALLGAIRMGAAYLALDTESPAQRLQLMVDDCRPSLILSDDASMLEGIRFSGPVLHLPGLVEGKPSEVVTGSIPAQVADPNLVAYVCYTSGSTGQPKGVAVTHRNVIRLVRETNFASFNQDETFLFMAPLAFDASTLEIWGPLLNGGRLVIMPPGKPSLHDLSLVLQRSGITTLWLTSSLFQLMVDQEPRGLHGLRQLLAGGDVLPPEPVRKLLGAAPSVTVINGYGPTENTTFTCCHSMKTVADVGPSVSIGRPVSNTRVYLLNARMELVIPGEAGELFTGGDGVALGYLNRPELTAERFVPDPFGPVGGRLYRTGDMARFHADGTIEFLGRRDHQIKLRGFRIELGEIESALRSIPGIQAAAASVIPDPGGDPQLVGFATAAAGSSPHPDLRQPLKPLLPDYMIPSRFVWLQEMPLNNHGKLDRFRLASLAAVPSNAEAAESLQREKIQPRNETESVVLQVWREVLSQPELGMTDDFFASGGHSLKATRIVSQLRQKFKVDLSLRSVFENPTPAGLSAVLKSLASNPAAVSGNEPALVPRRRDGARSGGRQTIAS